jgi:hypothetical protein
MFLRCQTYHLNEQLVDSMRWEQNIPLSRN